MNYMLFSEVVTERAVQDAQFGGASHDDQLTPPEWLSIMMRHLGLAAGNALGPRRRRPRRQLVRVAALAVAALESWDRKNPDRTAGPTITGSGF